MHAIRLRGPWEFSIAGTSLSGRIDLPCDRSELAAALATGSSAADPLAEKGPITLTRHFHLPTGLEQGDRVWLAVRCIRPVRAARLNGMPLPLAEQGDGSQRAELTGLLSPRNELAIDLPLPSPAPPISSTPILEVALEIDPPPAKSK